jgi:hypothetical protein
MAIKIKPSIGPSTIERFFLEHAVAIAAAVKKHAVVVESVEVTVVVV